VIDSGRPRYAAARAMHNDLSRDGIDPREFFKMARDAVARHGVEFLEAEVVEARTLPPAESPASFEVRIGDGRTFRSRKLLIATGVRDHLPEVEGVEEYYGRGVYHCPDRDAWEHRDRALVAHGDAKGAVGMALAFRTWSDRVTACTDGEKVAPKDRDRAARNGISPRTERLARLEGDGETLRSIAFRAGPPLECDACFFNTGHAQHSPLAARLNCDFDDDDHVRTREKQRTCKPGLFLAGDADGDVQFVIIAAAEGAKAAVAINRELQDEDRGEVRARRHSKRLAGLG